MKKLKASSNSNFKGDHRGCNGGQAKAKDVCIGEEEDRISELPDNIISHILSFSDDTVDAVRTSVLSKRWRYVWTSVPNISISDDRIPLNSNRYFKKCHFVNFVDNVLRLNVVSSLREFSLTCEYFDGDDDNAQICEWIRAVFTRNVEVFEIGFTLHQEVDLPRSFFTCCGSNVVVLKIGDGIFLDVPTQVYLPNLKILQLEGVTLFNEVSTKNLLEGCPVLEEFDILCYYYINMETLFVQSTSLKRLKITIQLAPNEAFGIFVHATNLVELDLIYNVKLQCELNSLSSLIQANLDLSHYTSYSDSEADSESESTLTHGYGNNVVEILSKISNTKYMSLSETSVKFLEQAQLDNLPMFHNLTRLEVVIGEHSLQVLLYLLQCSPNLLALVLRTSSHIYQHKLHKKISKPKCLMLSLQEIEIGIFKGCADEMNLVSYFLENATVLKKMSIHHYYSGSKQKAINKKLLMFRRSSSACQVVFN